MGLDPAAVCHKPPDARSNCRLRLWRVTWGGGNGAASTDFLMIGLAPAGAGLVKKRAEGGGIATAADQAAPPYGRSQQVSHRLPGTGIRASEFSCLTRF